MRHVSRGTSVSGNHRLPSSATILQFVPRRARDAGGTVAAAGPMSPAVVIPFAAADGHRRFTPQDRVALIALSYTLTGWTVAFESDGQDMQWAVLWPPDTDHPHARYLVGRDGNALVLLAAASGRVLGCYATGAALAQGVKRWEAAPRSGRQCEG